VPDRGPWDLRVARQLLDICRSERVSIWHGHDYKSNLLGLVLRRWWPMKLVTTVHGWVKFTWRTPLYYGIDRLCLRHYDRVICVSEDLHRECLAAKVPTDRCTFVQNAIDAEQFRRRLSVAEARRELGLPGDGLLIGTAGRLSPEKNFEGLIRAVQPLLKPGSGVRLLIIGEGEDRPRLERLIAELQCADAVRLLGYRADMIALYQAMDLFVLNSLREGLPNVLLEAMAMEIPVVATRVAGIPGLVAHDSNGLLVDAGDGPQLRSALERLLADPSLRTQLGSSARRTIEQRYSFAARMDRVQKIFAELLDVASPRSHSEPLA
jgi:glycosyltransferase involved in cell wall biosynthesis